MVVMLRWWLLAAIFLGTVVHAQDDQAVLPDPLTLQANWWGYFEPVEPINKAELDARIVNTLARLEQLQKNVGDEQFGVLSPLVTKIQDGLSQYSSLRSAAGSEAPTPIPSSTTYSVTQALERFTLWRKQKRELDLELADLAWQNAQLSLERKRQSQRRSDYLQLAPADPQRMSLGIALMSSRVSLELVALQTKRRSARLKDVGLQVQRLDAELEMVDQRLVPSSTDNEHWLKEQSRVKAKANALRQQVAPTVSDQSPNTPLGSANIKYLLLAAAGTDAQISIYELSAMRYRVMHALELSIASQPVPQQDGESLTAVLAQFLDFKRSIDEQQQSWHSLTEQSRKFGSAQTVNSDPADAALTQAYQRLLKQADENDYVLRDLVLEQDTAEFLSQLAQAKLNSDVGWFKRWLITMESGLGKSWGQVGQWINATLFEINEVPVTTMGLLRVLFIIVIALLISKVFRRGLDRIGQRKDGVSSSSLYTLGRVIHYIILVVGIIVALSSIGIDFTKFALFVSALGVGIGFGLQTLISNFVAGLIILFERSLKVGDFVELSSGLSGEVKEINMRSTLITTNDNVDILVPNSEFVNGQVTNWTLRDVQRRIHVPFGVAYGTDKDLVKKAVLEAADEVKWTLKSSKNRHPQVWFVQFGDSSLNFELVLWLIPDAVKRPGAVQAAYLWEIDTKLSKYGIEIPFPQRDLHLRSVFGKKDDAGLPLINQHRE